MKTYGFEEEDIVAPHVGAWIETSYTFCALISASVAPHVGAWIETSSPSSGALSQVSRPTWARGLKLSCTLLYPAMEGRAPRGRVD